MPPRDEWADSARLFYAEETALKNSLRAYGVFSRAYRKLVERIPLERNWEVLDIGCGTGSLVHALSGHVKSISGIDVSAESLSIARQKNPAARLMEADMTRIPLPGGQFDCAIAMTSLEFCAAKRGALAEIHRLLKPHGTFYLEVRNASFILFVLPRPVLGWCAAWGLLAPYPAEGFRDLTYQEWRGLLEISGFEIIQEFPSLRPWNYGSAGTRIKNLVIRLLMILTPLERHYMIGFLCRRPA